jgi:hypothetical protein
VKRNLLIVSGIEPGSSGTGRFLSYLVNQGARVVYSMQGLASVELPCTLSRYRAGGILLRLVYAAPILYVRRWYFYAQLYLLARDHRTDVIILHPQSIGMRRTIRFLNRRRSLTYMYLLDSSFFCIRSYNFVDGESKSCTRCVGGGFEAAEANNCNPFPTGELYAGEFARNLRRLAVLGRVKFMAQCDSQRRLAEQHFGVKVPIVGLWASDWDECFARTSLECERDRETWDVVLHSHWVEAKGAHWMLEVARQCPEIRFLFPFGKPSNEKNELPNCTFRTMSWESGLAEAIRSAKIVAVPSLWSASIEGALVKSLATGRAVAVVENESAFSSELPDELILRLPADRAKAARRLKDAVSENWKPQEEVRARWLKDFKSRNQNMCSVVVHTVMST